jgi:alditol oxidase
MSTLQMNWARSFSYGATRWHSPRTPDEVTMIVRSARRVKVLGTRHCFNDIADTDGEMISCDQFERVVEIDRDRRVVVVDGGIRYGELCTILHSAGYALPNLASLPHISIVGACATATHGSGERNGNLATSIAGIEFVSGNGEIITLTRDREGDEFYGAVVGLGALGVVTRVTLDIIPTFEIAQTVYELLPWAALQEHFNAIMSRAYSVSLFLDWRGDYINQVWVKRVVSAGGSVEPGAMFGAARAQHDVHPIPGADPVHCTRQMGVPGPWHDRLPHFRMKFVPSSGEELQSEYFVPRDRAVEAMNALREIRDRISPMLHISEIRAIRGDDLWLSPCYKQDSIAFHFTWKKDWGGVQQALPHIEGRLQSFTCRPHWGKLFTMQRQRVQSLFSRMPDFQRLVREHDKEGRFHNAFLKQFILE